MAEESPKKMDPTALPISDAAQLLTKVGGRLVMDTMLRADIDAGAPTNADGTVNLVHYAAWLIKEMARGD